MIFGIFKSIKKSSSLVKYSKMIAKSYEVDAFDFKASMKATRNRDDGINGLIDLALNDTNNKAIIKKYKINKKNLRKKYDTMVINGAGQVASGHWVAGSALVYTQTLMFLYDKKLTKGMSIPVQAYALIEYFEQNKTGPVVS